MTGYGNYQLLHFVTEQGTRGFVLFGHLAGFNVPSNTEAEEGDCIASSGNTGSSTGPHVHLGLALFDNIKMRYNYVNPLDYFNL